MKKFFALLVTLILVMSLVGCGTDEDEGTTSSSSSESTGGGEATDEVVTINFYEHTDSEKIVTELVDAYNAQSENIKVNLTLIANDDYDDKIKVMLSGGADIDGLWLRGGSTARELGAQGALLSLNDLNAANGVDTSDYGEIAKAFENDGESYALLTSRSCWLLWYNKDLFDAAGEEYPINLNWEEYTQLAARLTTDDLMGSICPDWMINIGSVAAGEYLTDESLDYSKQYIELLERWYVTDYSHPSIEDMSGSWDINGDFGAGATYMMINGDWEFLLLPDAVKDSFEFCAAPLPIFEGLPEGSTVGSAAGFSIAANSKHPEETYDFIKFCNYSEEGAKIYAKYSQVPCYPSDAALEVYNENVTTEGTQYVFSSKVNAEDGIESYYEELKTAFKDEMRNALIGNVTIDEAFDTFRDRRDEIEAQ